MPPTTAVGEGCRGLRSGLEREPRLPDSPGARHREHSHVRVAQQRADFFELGLATDERRRGDGKVRDGEGLERWELRVPQLVDALRRGEVLQAVLAEVDQVGAFALGYRRGRDEHLAAVTGGSDSRRPMNVHAHVALVGQKRRARVDPDPDPDRAGGERLRRLVCGGNRAGRRPEGDEKCVSLGVDLDTAVGGEGLTQEAAVLGERLRIRLGAEIVQELGRAFDVGEEKGDGSGRELAPHGPIMTPTARLRHVHGPEARRKRRGSPPKFTADSGDLAKFLAERATA